MIKKLYSTIANIIAIFELCPAFFGLKLEKKIAKLLIRNGLTLSTAESCTGGLISSRLTDVSGSSLFVKQNFITYSNESKTEHLGVEPELIKEYGVVSKEVATAMAKGVLKHTSSDIAIATTGIAGPTGGSKKKPVGLIYLSVANFEKTKTIRFNANRFLNRRIIKFIFSQVAMQYLYKFLKEEYFKEKSKEKTK
ncbi:MAG: CinA family protein [Candidatus Gastranaerophilales bacterium]|nr:CinA family protein [Candidatus Gastranaerophilales bacterium]